MNMFYKKQVTRPHMKHVGFQEKSPYKILKLSTFSRYLIHTISSDARGSTSLPELLYVAAN